MLPNELRGDWIWSKDHVHGLDPHLFLRKDFTLDETPMSAELFISARTAFHLFVNGRHVCFGPGASPNRDAYVMRLDVGFLIETGRNFIGVVAHNTAVARLSARRQPGGFWCQLNINGQPAVWTSSDWLMHEAACYIPNRPRSSAAGAFAEKLDFRLYPENWEQKTFDHFGWQNPDFVVPLSEDQGRLVELEQPELNFAPAEFAKIVMRGGWDQQCPVTHVSFAEVAGRRGTGVYSADTHYNSPNTKSSLLEVYADNPYRLFVNGQLVKEQGVIETVPGTDLVRSQPRCFRQEKMVAPECTVKWQKGWNHICLIQQVEPGSAGMTMILREQGRTFDLQRDVENEAKLGWFINGPLQAPLANILKPFQADPESAVAYVPGLEGASDEAASLMSCNFVPAGDQDAGTPADFELANGEFVILDLSRTVYGCPDLRLSGSDGDVLDIICGEELVDGRVPPYSAVGQHVDTVILGPDPVRWLGFAPRGLRFLMLVVRECGDIIKVSGANVKCRAYNWENRALFESSDEVLNAVWKAGRQTLDATVQDVFLDAATGEPAQRLADAMVQAWAAGHVYGDFRLAAKTLREFALQQFENGEMLTVCPSDMYISRADEALLWPIWLHRHNFYSGDSATVKKLLPALRRLLSYFAGLADKEGGVISLEAFPGDNRGVLEYTEAGGERGIATGLNAIYCRALLCASALFEQCEEAEDAEKCKQLADSVAARIRQLTWNEKKGLFADGAKGGRKSASYSWLANVLAIYGGVAKADWFNPIFDQIFTQKAPYFAKAIGVEDNPLLQFFVMETAFAIGRQTWAVEFMRDNWGGTLERGAATWCEKLGPAALEPGLRRCYGAASFPNSYLLTEIAGIRPAEPGFTAVYLSPMVEAAAWLKAQVPTPYGHINIEWATNEDGQVEMLVDANYPVHVLPVFSQELQERIVFHLTDAVSLLGADEEPAEADTNADAPGAEELEAQGDDTQDADGGEGLAAEAAEEEDPEDSGLIMKDVPPRP